MSGFAYTTAEGNRVTWEDGTLGGTPHLVGLLEDLDGTDFYLPGHGTLDFDLSDHLRASQGIAHHLALLSEKPPTFEGDEPPPEELEEGAIP